jgi:hypothetical protein
MNSQDLLQTKSKKKMGRPLGKTRGDTISFRLPLETQETLDKKRGEMTRQDYVKKLIEQDAP